MSFNHKFSRLFSTSIIILTSLATLLTACGDSSPTPAPAPATSASTSPTSAVSTTIASNTNITLPPRTTVSSVTNNTTVAPSTSAASTIVPATTAAATTATASGQATPGQTTLPTAPAIVTKVNGEKINMTVELARTGAEQETGLMGRTTVPDDTGMLFIFPNTGRVAFWMKDTPLPLSIAFITQDGKIIDIQDMEPFSLDNHAPDQDYKTALEVAKGYFAKRGIAPGDTFTYQS